MQFGPIAGKQRMRQIAPGAQIMLQEARPHCRSQVPLVQTVEQAFADSLHVNAQGPFRQVGRQLMHEPPPSTLLASGRPLPKSGSNCSVHPIATTASTSPAAPHCLAAKRAISRPKTVAWAVLPSRRPSRRLRSVALAEYRIRARAPGRARSADTSVPG